MEATVQLWPLHSRREAASELEVQTGISSFLAFFWDCLYRRIANLKGKEIKAYFQDHVVLCKEKGRWPGKKEVRINENTVKDCAVVHIWKFS